MLKALSPGILCGNITQLNKLKVKFNDPYQIDHSKKILTLIASAIKDDPFCLPSEM
jgi:hypothetical protein